MPVEIALILISLVHVVGIFCLVAFVVTDRD